MAAKAVLTEELAAFFESGLSINMATRDDDLRPDGGPAWAARVHDDRRHITVFVHSKAAPPLLANLERHPEIAVLFEQPSSHRACQVKGTFTGSRKAKTTERQEILRQMEAFRADLEQIGIPKDMTAQGKAWPCLAIELLVSQLFEQTPGPGAGEPLK